MLLPLAVQGFSDLADARLREGAYEEAIGHLEAGFSSLGSASDQKQPHLRRILTDRLAWVLFRQGKLDEAYAQASAAAADVTPECVDDPMTLASLYNTLGGIYWQQGNLPGAISYVQRSLELYERLGDTWGMANCYTNLGLLFYVQGAWRRAAEFMEQADVLRRDNGYLSVRALGLKNLGLLRIALGDHAQAQQDLESSLTISRRLGDSFGVVLTEIGLAALAVKQTLMSEAAAHLAAARELLEAAGEDQAIQVAWLAALVRAHQGELKEAIAGTEQALELARAAGLWEEEADCLRALGILHTQAGTHAEAEQCLQASVDLSQRQGDSYRQGQALLELGRLYLCLPENGTPASPVNQQQARVALRDAADKFASLGAAFDLEQAQAALSQI
jgi:tetratricopeptide (TPR) repeat protein